MVLRKQETSDHYRPKSSVGISSSSPSVWCVYVLRTYEALSLFNCPPSFECLENEEEMMIIDNRRNGLQYNALIDVHL